MTTAEFLSHIRDLGINLWLDGDELRYSAPKGALTQKLRTELIAHKAEILAFLHETQMVASPESDEAIPETVKAYVAPRTQIEETLAKIWAGVLGVERVGIYDNFFDLGGDSLLSMQVVVRANQAGLRFTPWQLLQHQTVAEMAEVEGSAVVEAEQGLVAGPLPLIPNSLAYFRSPPQPWWRLFEALFLVPQGLDATSLAQVAQHLVRHHDGLRLRVARNGSDYQQFIAESDDAVFCMRDLSGLSKDEQERAIGNEVEGLWAGMDLATGPLLRFVYFDLGRKEPARLLILVHHLVADAYSIQILLDDFQIACQQLMQRQAIALPPKTTSLKRWAERMYEYVRSSAWEQEVKYWLSLPWTRVRPIPADYPERFVVDESSSLASGAYLCSKDPNCVSDTLSTEETQILAQRIPVTYNVSVLDVLLTGLVIAFDQWAKLHPLYLLIIGNGRSGFEDLDLSRTVGDLAGNSVYPALLVLEGGSDPIRVLTSVKGQLDRIPNGGVNRHWGLTHAGETMLAHMPNIIHLIFNYHGHIKERQGNSGLFHRIDMPSGESTACSQDAGSDRQQYTVSYPFECEVMIYNGQLGVEWLFRDELHKTATVVRLVQTYLEALRALAACICDRS
jgi:non-ribosomal peptide synthase protein (TIGR01720 family)